MSKLVDAFLHRVAPEGIHHHTIEIDADEASGLDRWGNEWEADNQDEGFPAPRFPSVY